jgi:hypothetical protein
VEVYDVAEDMEIEVKDTIEDEVEVEPILLVVELVEEVPKSDVEAVLDPPAATV